MFKLEPTAFPDLYVVHFFKFEDHRGIFFKPYLHKELGQIFGEVAETYVSTSAPQTFRGLHFQRGANAQGKYVVCLGGTIEDVAVDLRPSSATFGRVFRYTLKVDEPVGLIIPGGFAHGIYAHTQSTIANFCNKPYSPEDEGGIHPGSIPEISDLEITTLSSKDANLPPLSTFLQ